jgi:photosystem II stability/assembly factor-like uncharacterized protein
MAGVFLCRILKANKNLPESILKQPSCSFFYDNDIWLGGDSLFHSDNGGSIWSQSNQGKDCKDIWFIKRDIGWMTNGKQIFFTTDSGISWKNIFSFSNKSSVERMFFLDENYGWLLLKNFENRDVNTNSLGYDNEVFKTADGGKTWILSYKDEAIPNFLQIYFVDSNNGWLVTEAKVFQTKDGGANWNLSLDLETPIVQKN